MRNTIKPNTSLVEALRLANSAVPIDKASEIMKAINDSGVECYRVIFKSLSKAFRLLGSGCFSSAFSLGSGWVLKINIDSEYMGLNDSDSGFVWLRKCTEYQDNRFVPIIAGLERSGPMYLAVMEQLDAYGHDWYCDGSPYFTHLNRAYRRNPTGFSWEKYMAREDLSLPLMQMAISSKEEVLEVSQLMVAAKRSARSRWDLHSDNIMVRRDGTLVITDPLAEADRSGLYSRGTYSWQRVL